MIPRSLGIALSFFATTSLLAQFLTPETVDWQEVRARQPEGLVLTIDLPKTTFRQGEVVDAMLTFRNTSSTPYHLWVGTGDRSGRIPDIAFYAVDAKGKSVADPLRWYFERGAWAAAWATSRTWVNGRSPSLPTSG